MNLILYREIVNGGLISHELTEDQRIHSSEIHLLCDTQTDILTYGQTDL